MKQENLELILYAVHAAGNKMLSKAISGNQFVFLHIFYRYFMLVRAGIA
jgi:hypothetical protein